MEPAECGELLKSCDGRSQRQNSSLFELCSKLIRESFRMPGVHQVLQMDLS
jgi:hypothetical protein